MEIEQGRRISPAAVVVAFNGVHGGHVLHSSRARPWPPHCRALTRAS